MPHTKVVGRAEQGKGSCPVVEYSDPHECQASCDADAKCVAWATAKLKGQRHCCHKTTVVSIKPDNGTTSGVKDPLGWTGSEWAASYR